MESLSSLVKLEEFAGHLSGVTRSFIKTGSYSPSQLFERWLLSHHDASWRDVLIALDATHESELLVNVLHKLATNHPLSTRYICTIIYLYHCFLKVDSSFLSRHCYFSFWGAA